MLRSLVGMLYFRDHHWLPVSGTSRFSVRISPKDTRSEDLLWTATVHYTAGGAAWRRVKEWHRPRIAVEISGFQPRVRHWTELEGVSFWEFASWEEPSDGGSFVFEYAPAEGTGPVEYDFLGEAIWRIRERDRRFFGVEFAGFLDQETLQRTLDAVPVLTDGQPDRSPDEEFWKANAQLYLVEDIPFGTVTVQVPRNARDPEAYAIGRARTLLGLGQPEHLALTDHSLSPNADKYPRIQGDLYALLHYHGYYED